jgi:hypothetical protein
MLKNRQPAKPYLWDRVALRMSTGRETDGVWLGAFTNRDESVLRRVEDALQLMKRHNPLHYTRVTGDLDRIWVHLTPGADGNYARRLNTCELDERFVMQEETTLERIASTIVHEATHARLERWGFAYDEAKRHRIEAICLRRELNFVSGLAGCEALQQSIRDSLDYYGDNAEFFSDKNMRQRFDDGSLETLRWLGVPIWLVALLSKTINWRHRLRSPRAAAAR